MLYTKPKNSCKVVEKAMQKNGIKKVKMLPLKTLFTNGGPAAPLSSNPPKNTKNRPLAPQQPRKGVRLSVCVQ